MYSRTLVIAAGIATTGAATRADTVDLRFLNVGPSRVVSISGVISGNFYAGVLNHQATNGTGSIGSGISGSQSLFCTDLSQVVTTTGATYQLQGVEAAPVPGGGMGTSKANAIREIYYAANNTYGGQQFTNADDAAIFQSLIWEIIYDFDGSNASSIDFSVGNLRLAGLPTNPGAAAFKSGLLSAIGSGRYETHVFALTSPGNQDQLILVPLPTNALLALSGAIPVILARRRWRRS